MDSRIFDRPSGFRLVPEPEYLLQASSFSEFKERYQEARELRDELDDLDSRLVELWRRERDLRINRNTARRRQRKVESSMRYDQGRSTAIEQAEEYQEAADEMTQELQEVLEEIEEVETRREEIGRHLDRNFVAVKEARGPDLSPPDEEDVKDTHRMKVR